MTGLAEAALAGYGIAVAVGWFATRLEAWWRPTWRVSQWAFTQFRHTGTVAAAAAIASSDGRLVARVAAGTAAWLVAQCYVLLLVAVRR